MEENKKNSRNDCCSITPTIKVPFTAFVYFEKFRTQLKYSNRVNHSQVINYFIEKPNCVLQRFPSVQRNKYKYHCPIC